MCSPALFNVQWGRQRARTGPGFPQCYTMQLQNIAVTNCTSTISYVSSTTTWCHIQS